MLSLLHIENIAVIESADISFDHGFNVLTGETGAGKSIVIDAISAILGERAYRDMIRTGTGKASVRAVFTDVPELAWFADNGVEYDAETVIQREIHLDGKNVCRVNGSLVSVSILRKLGMQLINIHGQHDSATLFDEDNHLTFLDAFADNEALRADYREKYEAVSRLRREIDRMTMDEGEKLRRMPKRSATVWIPRWSAFTAAMNLTALPVCWHRRNTPWQDLPSSAMLFRRCMTGWRISCTRSRMWQKRSGMPGMI